MYERTLRAVVVEALGDSPVVLVNGPRQSGKSTLVQSLLPDPHSGRYQTLDDATTFAAATVDPAGFLAGHDGRLVIDEVQRAPGLFRALKAEVDRRRTPGRFLLTGSADVLLLPRLAESLAGRMEVHTLWPLSERELESTGGEIIDLLFGDPPLPRVVAPLDRSRLLDRIVVGGFPEPVKRPSARRRDAWFSSYVATLLARDVRDLAHVEGLAAMPRLLSLLAARSAALLNLAELSRASGLPQSTLNRYVALLQALFLVQPLAAWSRNLGKRLVRAPKLHLVDTGLAAHLLGADAHRLAANGELLGPLLESFVVNELRKQQGWSRLRSSMFHFRSHAGEEVDIVLEDAAGRCVGIEVRASATVTGHDFRGLRAFAEAAGKHFVRGVVLYTGGEAIPFGERLFALPLPALWAAGARHHRRAR